MLLRANALHIPLADESVQCCVTSPPYWGLRDYQLEPTIWPDGWRGCLGLEPTPSAYIEHMVAIFREVRRVLRGDGVCWLNLGDSYAGSGAVSQQQTDADIRHATVGNALKKCQRRVGSVPNHKPKDLVGIPWRVAFALQADGWWLRSDIIWHKPNPMPESVTDRPTKAHEYIFLLTKSARYFYDAEAVKESSVYPNDNRKARAKATQKRMPTDAVAGIRPSSATYPTRNRRTVWTVATRPYKGAHFATYPPDLIEPCILAGTSAKGACPACGAPWERVVERKGGKSIAGPKSTEKRERGLATAFSGYDDGSIAPTFTTTGWRPTCSCLPAIDDPGEVVDGDQESAWAPTPRPCIVLDPFGGSGTTGEVCIKHGREFVLLDLNGEYLGDLATERLSEVQPVLL